MRLYLDPENLAVTARNDLCSLVCQIPRFFFCLFVTSPVSYSSSFHVLVPLPIIKKSKKHFYCSHWLGTVLYPMKLKTWDNKTQDSFLEQTDVLRCFFNCTDSLNTKFDTLKHKL
jgi:hypothetical protein